MKVLLVGATGNVGSRLLPALLTHGHTVVIYVRSAKKVESLFPESVNTKIKVVEGDAKDPKSIKRAILDNHCDAVVTAAGVAAVMPWASSDLPDIFRSVLTAVQDAGQERKAPLRTWFLGGMGVLNYPGTQSLISNHMPIFLEHRKNYQLLKSLPQNAVDWSLLCPMTMNPESSDLSVPTHPSQKGKLLAKAGSPPGWHDSWLRHIPLIGRTLVIGMNSSRYVTTLEQNAEFIADDLETRDSRWIGTTVGVIDASQ